MAILLDENEQVTVPVSGKRVFKLDANGVPVLVMSTGAAAPTVSPATTSAAGSMSAADKTKIDGLYPISRGADLADEDATLQPFSGGFSVVVMPAATMTTDRTITLGNTDAPGAGHYWSLIIIRRDLTANQLIVKKADTTTIHTDAASPTHSRALEFVCQNGVWTVNTAWIVA